MVDSDVSQRDAVRWAYRLLLGREPESEAAIDVFKDHTDVLELSRMFINSAEFRERAQRLIGLSTYPDIVPLVVAANEVQTSGTPAEIGKLRAHVQAVWTRLGQEAPHWSVLSSEDFLPDKIEESEEDFFASGTQDVHLIDSILRRHGKFPGDFNTCFEFGCGLGRVSIPLASMFKQVVACDISTSHLNAARQRADKVNARNIKFVEADAANFGMNEQFNLWFSRIVLQHNPPPIMALILARMFNQLAKGGLAIFQVPTYAVKYNFSLPSYLESLKSENQIEMHCLPQTAIFEIADANGAVPLEIREEFSAGHPSAWISNLFVFKKK